MSSSAINQSVFQAKVSGIQNQADSTSIYSNGVWSFKNSTALTSVTITDAGNVGIGVSTPNSRLHAHSTGNVPLTISSTQTTSYLQIDSSAGASGIASNGNALVFYTSNIGTERARIDASGNLLVGTTSADPSTALVNGTAIGGIGYLSANRVGNTWGYIGRSSTTGIILQFRYGGTDVGNISTNGSTITFSGNAVSDERWKENLNPINNALSSVKQIQFVEFDYKENKQKSAGVTAQQLQTIPELSKFVIDGSDEESYKAVDYNALIGYLGKAIQELSAKNDEQSSRIDALEARLAALEAKP